MWEPSDADDIDDLVRMEAEIMEEGGEYSDMYYPEGEDDEPTGNALLPENFGAQSNAPQSPPSKRDLNPSVSSPRSVPLKPLPSSLSPSAVDLLNSSRPMQRKVKAVESLAATLHAERKALYGDALNSRITSAHSLFEEGQELITLQPMIAKIRDGRRWLHDLPQGDNCKMITLGNQKRFYLHDYSAKSAVTMDSPHSSRLLAKTGAQLQDEIDNIMKQQLLFERTKDAHQESAAKTLSGPAHRSTALWVDKYSPKSFMQLLSPERINRAVLMAVKKWDKFVFKRQSAALDASSALQNAAAAAAGADSRPFHKIILLAGPPGTGKTTLAHIVASMCGYNIVEVNASDERSAEHLQEILARAMSHNANSFQAGRSASSRPNCVILDEVDGMDNNKVAIQHLIDMIQAPLVQSGSAQDSNPSSAQDEENGADGQPSHRSSTSRRSKRSSARSHHAPVTRPIFLICNNLYAPALMQIKKYCEVFSFAHASNQSVTLRIQQKLKHICQQESLGHLPILQQPSFLNDLVVKANGDIRSSIHALQFLASTTSLSRSASSTSANVSSRHHNDDLLSKDMASDSMMIWKQAFHLGASSSSTASSAPSTSLPSGGDFFASLLSAAMNYGDAQHITAGLYENLSVLFDNYLYKFVHLYEWFSDMDVLNEYYASNMLLYENSQYQSLLVGVVHAYYSSKSASLCGQRLTWPRKDKDAYYRKQQKLALAGSILHGQAALLRQPSTQQFILEMASTLLDIVNPSLRALPFFSLSAEEQARVREVATIMECSGLRYVPDRHQPLPSSSHPSFQRPPRSAPGEDQTEGQGARSRGMALEGRKLVLEPNLPLLVSFHASDILAAEARPLTLKAANQFKYQMSTSPAGGGGGGGGPASEGVSALVWQQRKEVSKEVKEAIAVEQHRISILLKAQRFREKQDRVDGTGMSVSGRLGKAVPPPLPPSRSVPVLSSSLAPASGAESGEKQKEGIASPEKAATKSWMGASPSLPANILDKINQADGGEEPNKARKGSGISSFFQRSTGAGQKENRKRLAPSSTAAEEATGMPGVQLSTHASGPAGSAGLYFKFCQGYSNAVKRPVSVQDFLKGFPLAKK